MTITRVRICVLSWLLLLSVGCTQPNAQTTEQPITTDEACELLVTHATRVLFDGWAMRYQYVVWCNSAKSNITVSITPSNGQEGSHDSALMKRQAEAAIGALIERKRWADRYTKVTVQFI